MIEVLKLEYLRREKIKQDYCTRQTTVQAMATDMKELIKSITAIISKRESLNGYPSLVGLVRRVPKVNVPIDNLQI
ncbi:hypothetical protein [Nitrososphaera sp. AFS]|uniref:hypothetical protein n=1 Tax=Nitrososphaera sp. AFS TaxID=2301191 RepID=UPI0013922A6B|nr:hypothetical protein [Nitrososphaera sp. AFS]NAL78054.1 hypothetical protein [Nitrososphaera sp. AFS]